MSNLHTKETDQLFEAILHLRSLEDCYAFFEDLCTIKELKDLSQRLEVARLLDQGMSYQEVTKRTGVSSTTTCRVKRCLEYGSGGYQAAMRAMEEKR